MLQEDQTATKLLGKFGPGKRKSDLQQSTNNRLFDDILVNSKLPEKIE